MNNSALHAEQFAKIESGLMLAGATQAQASALKSVFDSMPAVRASEIMRGGDFSGIGFVLSKSDDAKARRNLARAVNYLLGMAGYANNQAYRVNKIFRQRILDKNTSLDAALRSVKLEIDNIVPVTKAVAPVTPRIAPCRITPGVGIVKAVATPVSRVVDQAMVVNTAKLKFMAGGARYRRLMDHVGSESLGTAWSRATSEIIEYGNQDREWLLVNQTTMLSAIDDAFAGYKASVQENQEALRDRVDFVSGLLFHAFSYAPWPLSLIGTIGEKVTSQITVDPGIDPRTSGAALRLGEGSGFMRRLNEMLDSYNEAVRVGPRLDDLRSATSVKATFVNVCAHQRKQMQEILASLVNEHFGDSSTVVEKFKSFKINTVQKNYAAFRGSMPSGVRGDSGTIDVLLTEKITAYKKEVIAQIKTLIQPVPLAVSHDDMRLGVEMMLYCSYINALFKNEADYTIKPLARSLIDFFAQQGLWGILFVPAAGAKNSQQSAMDSGRLAFKDDANHRKVLKLFCEWYVLNINPFMMAVGARRNGFKYDDKLIHGLCKNEIMKINTAIDEGRRQKKGIFSIGINWDWEKINAKYEALTLARPVPEAG